MNSVCNTFSYSNSYMQSEAYVRKKVQRKKCAHSCNLSLCFFIYILILFFINNKKVLKLKTMFFFKF